LYLYCYYAYSFVCFETTVLFHCFFNFLYLFTVYNCSYSTVFFVTVCAISTNCFVGLAIFLVKGKNNLDPHSIYPMAVPGRPDSRFISRSINNNNNFISQRLYTCSVVVKDLRLEDEDKDEDLKIGPRGSSRTKTFLGDNTPGLK